MGRTADDVAGLTGWNADWAGLRVAVLGLGVTGFSVADTLAELGAELVVLADQAGDETVDLLDVIGVRLARVDLESELAAFAPELVVVSPGFAPTHPLVAWCTSVGVPVWGDVELAWRLRDCSGRVAEWIAITGTNGKTTTTQLTTAMLVAGGKRSIACGNVGVPVLDAVRDPIGFDALVVELSSFQLHYLKSMSAWSSVCLNVADDHLDWHGSPAAYRAAKGSVYERTRVACVYNLEDDTTRELVEEAEVVDGCRAIGFGRGIPGPSDVGLVEEIVVDRAFLADRWKAAIEITTVPELETVGLGSPRPSPHGDDPRARRCPLGERLEGDQSACGQGRARIVRVRGVGGRRIAQGGGRHRTGLDEPHPPARGHPDRGRSFGAARCVRATRADPAGVRGRHR